MLAVGQTNLLLVMADKYTGRVVSTSIYFVKRTCVIFALVSNACCLCPRRLNVGLKFHKQLPLCKLKNSKIYHFMDFVIMRFEQEVNFLSLHAILGIPVKIKERFGLPEVHIAKFDKSIYDYGKCPSRIISP